MKKVEYIEKWGIDKYNQYLIKKQKYQRKYNKNNRDKLNRYQREYHNRNYRLNPVYTQRYNSGIITTTMTDNDLFKETLGCNVDQFRSYIEDQFTTGMTWDNYGHTWEFDHIIPLGQQLTEEEVLVFSHYTNVRPLNKLINRSNNTRK